MNKRGKLVLRDVIFMLIIFSGIIALASLLVTQMGTTYDNVGMVDSFNQDTIGKTQLTETGNKWEGIAEDLSGKNGIATLLIGGLKAIGMVLLEVITAPVTFANMLVSTLDIVGVSASFKNMVGFILATLLYVVIIFGIVKVFLKGGDI